MTIEGHWRIVAMPDYEADYPDMVEPAYIRFEAGGSGNFAFGCVTGDIWGAGGAHTVAFSWHGNDEMDEASGDGWVELQSDGTLSGEISFRRGDEVAFIARRWLTSSTAC
jgi:hypothetical protein